MDKRIKDFLDRNRICVISLVLPDGSVHGATAHYSYDIAHTHVLINTKKDSRKCLSLVSGKSVSGSVVIGFSEEEWIELQMDGEVRIPTQKEEIDLAQKIHFTKYPGYKKYENDPSRVYMLFRPSWYRYTEFHTEPRIVIEGTLKKNNES